MKKFQLVTLVLVSTLIVSPGAMAFSGDLMSGKGFTSGVLQNVKWKFSWDNLFQTFKPGNPNPGRPDNPGNSNSRSVKPASPVNSTPGPVASTSVAGAHAVPEMDAAGGIIAFSLMLSLFGFFREKRRQLSVS